MTPRPAGARTKKRADAPSTRKATPKQKPKTKPTSNPTTKRKVSVSLDEDLVEELEANGANLSAEINDAIRARVDHLRRRRLLLDWLDDLDRELGPPDAVRVERYAEAIRG